MTNKVIVLQQMIEEGIKALKTEDEDIFKTWLSKYHKIIEDDKEGKDIDTVDFLNSQNLPNKNLYSKIGKIF